MAQHFAVSAWVVPSPKMYTFKFGNVEVETTVTHDPSMVDSWITNTLAKNKTRLHRLIVGLDIEWTPNFRKGCHHSVALLQLCVGRSCLVYQIHRSEWIPTKLKRFLENWEYSFVGAGIKQDADKLEHDYNLRIPNMIDLGFWAAEQLEKEKLLSAGLKVLCGSVQNKAKNIHTRNTKIYVVRQNAYVHGRAAQYYFWNGEIYKALKFLTQDHLTNAPHTS